MSKYSDITETKARLMEMLSSESMEELRSIAAQLRADYGGDSPRGDHVRSVIDGLERVAFALLLVENDLADGDEGWLR
jgi:hypothetical protein